MCEVVNGFILLIHPSIHFLPLIRGWKALQAQQSSPDVPLPSNAFQLFRGDPEVFPGQMRCNPSRVFWVYLVVYYQLDVPGKLPKVVSFGG